MAASKFETDAPKSADSVSIIDRPLEDVIGWLLVCGCSFLNLANILVDKQDVGLDAQVLAKLGMTGLGGLYGFHGLLTRPKVGKILFSFPFLWLVIIGAFYFIAAAFSISPTNSLVSTCSIVAVSMLTVTALDHLGLMNTIKAMFYGMAMFILGSWFFYIAFPEIGVLAEPIAGGEFLHRMSGLAHANTLGQYAGLTVIICFVLLYSYKERSLIVLAIGGLALLALINSFSRTSLMAFMVAMAVGYRHLVLRKEYLGIFTIGAVVMLVGVLILGTQMDIGSTILAKLEALLSKSEGSDDLTTATGRSDIWAYVIHLLGQQPLIGYGAATQKYFLAEHSSYTHNMLLNIAFSGGIFAGIAAILMILGRLRSVVYNCHPLIDAIIVFIVVNGLFENVIFSILAGLPTMLWVVTLAWPHLKDDPAVKQLDRSSRSSDETRTRFIRLDP